MKITAVITINDRDVSTLDTVFSSMKEQVHDEFVIVLDRTPAPLADYCRTYWRDDKRVKFVDIDGEPGWRSPVIAWNHGFAAVTSPIVYAFSSETVQVPWNIESAKRMLTEHPNWVVFGKAECSCGPYGQEVNWNGTAPGNLLCDADHPRPLGFIWAARTDRVRQIGGYDEAFADGFWFDDACFFYRMWLTGADFVFDDAIRGTHLHHERPGLATPAGQAGIQRNAFVITQKHGSTDPLSRIHYRIERAPGRTIWRNSLITNG